MSLLKKARAKTNAARRQGAWHPVTLEKKLRNQCNLLFSVESTETHESGVWWWQCGAEIFNGKDHWDKLYFDPSPDSAGNGRLFLLDLPAANHISCNRDTLRDRELV